ncbi:MAG: methylated-DNA--[protein]-cysteine S-methyltransferase [Thermodesulfobacteriota bacterium]|nr:methylated-DNA--[protein]-cysteine S-methyltransferase [Thermodesulfobacteriota bacterium]
MFKVKKIRSGTCLSMGITLYLIVSENEIIHLTFEKKRHVKALEELGDAEISIRLDNPPFCREFSNYLAGKKTSFAPSPHSPFLDKGTDFQKQVWKLISRIPYGETRTYGVLARQLGSIGYARGVGQACRANPLPLLIPCHRVVGSQSLGGFSGGVEIKRKLLEVERKKVEGCRLKAEG